MMMSDRQISDAPVVSVSPCRHYSLQQLLDPLTVTWERLDYRLSWHLWGVLQALHYSHLSGSRQGLLHTSYAAQLESAGLWHMAIFILLHIPDHRYVLNLQTRFNSSVFFHLSTPVYSTFVKL